MVYIWDKATGTRIPVASDFAANGVPIGSVISSFSGVTPRGYLPFTGNTYNKSDYPELYAMLPAILKTGENQFTLPDLTGRVIQGADASTIGSLIAAGLPNITGAFSSIGELRMVDAKGALKQGERTAWRYNGASAHDGYSIELDAAAGETDTDGNLKTDESTKVFGKSNTVQAPAFGLYYYVKAVHYIDVSKDAIDDTAATDSNVWSAAKTKAEIEQSKVYSLEETVIGKWIDGKPIYRLVIPLTSPQTMSAANLTIGNSLPALPFGNFDNIAGFIDARINRFSGEIAMQQVGVKRNNSTQIRVYSQTEWTNITHLTLEYTKTAD